MVKRAQHSKKAWLPTVLGGLIGTGASAGLYALSNGRLRDPLLNITFPFTGLYLGSLFEKKKREERQRVIEVWKSKHPRLSEGSLYVPSNYAKDNIPKLKTKDEDIDMKNETTKGKKSPAKAEKKSTILSEHPIQRLAQMGFLPKSLVNRFMPYGLGLNNQIRGIDIDGYDLNYIEDLEGMGARHYRATEKKLKDRGFTEEELYEILEAPEELQVKPKKDPHDKKLIKKKSALIKQALDVYDKPWWRPISRKGEGNSGIEDLAGEVTEGDELSASLKNPEIAKYLDSVKDKVGLEDVAVYLGASRPLNKLKRLWLNKNFGIGSKILNTVAFPFDEYDNAKDRIDHYFGPTNSVNVYGNYSSVLGHELGHALDSNTAEKKKLFSTLYNYSPINQEYLVSNLAINDFARNLVAKQDATKDDLDALKLKAKQLENAFGSYYAYHGPRNVDPAVAKRIKKYKNKDALKFFLTDPVAIKQLAALTRKLK